MYMNIRPTNLLKKYKANKFALNGIRLFYGNKVMVVFYF